MVRVVIETGNDGLIRRVDVSGHAGASEKGYDIVCAAVTTLVRSAARVLEQDDRVLLRGGAIEPGRMGFDVIELRKAEQYLQGIGDFVILGIADIASEYPSRCTLELKERVDGT